MPDNKLNSYRFLFKLVKQPDYQILLSEFLNSLTLTYLFSSNPTIARSRGNIETIIESPFIELLALRRLKPEKRQAQGGCLQVTTSETKFSWSVVRTLISNVGDNDPSCADGRQGTRKRNLLKSLRIIKTYLLVGQAYGQIMQNKSTKKPRWTGHEVTPL